MLQTPASPTTRSQPRRSSLNKLLAEVSTGCTQCQSCVIECRFLQHHKDPKKIADAYDPADGFYQKLPFACSLCHLCTAVCPEGIDPAEMFLEMRRESVVRDAGSFRQHRGLEKYEQRGTSQRFSWYALPAGCDSIFFPGCGLPGSRPEQTLKTFALLQERIPNLGIVLDCCTKPSHDLGKQAYFHAMFGELKRFLLENGIKTVLVACPNCDQVFRQYAAELTTASIYEFLAAGELPETGIACATVNVHDPCVARFSTTVQAAVRNLAEKKGLALVETRHSGEQTLCCGEGGAVGGIDPELARGWTRQRAEETGGKHTVTYCSGCAHNLGRHGPTSHILDLIFEPQAALADQTQIAKGPRTYFNRLRVKKQLQENLAAAITRERTFTVGEKVNGGRLKKLAVLAISCGVILLLSLSKALFD